MSNIRERSAHASGSSGISAAQQAAEADRLVAQLVADELVTRGRGVPLVEDQVDDAEDAAEALRELRARGHPVGDVRVGDLALGAHDPLAHRRLAHQERARDLARAEPAERAQGERDLGGRLQRRVAAGEDQPQAVVHDRWCLVGERVVLARALLQLGQSCRPQVLRPPAADPVDRAPLGGRRQPAARVLRHAVARPRGGGRRVGVLERLLGEVEVADVADQHREHRAVVLAERTVDVGQADGRSSGANTGRTSTDPYSAIGSCRAQPIASSRSAQSSR